MKHQLLLICLVFFTVKSFTNDYSIENITTQQGLSQNNVYCIFNDSRGFMWFGTDDGLNRFDGYEFKTYRINLEDDSGLSSNLIRYIAEDESHNLWIGTTDRGINYFDYQTEKISSIMDPGNSSEFLIKGGVFSIIPIGSNELLIQESKNIRIIKTNGKNLISTTTLFSDSIADNIPVINSYYRQSEEKVWIGTIDGLYLYEKLIGSDSISFRKLDHLSAELNTTQILAYKNGLLLAALSGLYYLSQEEELFLVLNKRFYCVLLDSEQNLWGGTNKGLYKLTPQKDKSSPFAFAQVFTKENGLNSDFIFTLQQDKFGNIWAGSIGGGIVKINQQVKKFKHYYQNCNSSNISNYNVRSIFEDSYQNLWIGTEGGGISYLSSTRNNYGKDIIDLDFKPEELINNFVFFEIQHNNSRLVLAGTAHPTKNRAYIIDKNNKPIETSLPGKLADFKHQIFALEEDDNYLWVGTYNSGLFRYSYKDNQLIEFTNSESGTISSNIIRSIYNDSQNRLWIGTSNGLNMLSPAEKIKSNPTFRVFKNINKDEISLSLDYILPILESSRGVLWIGTMGGGLNRFNEDDNSFKRITTKEGLPNNHIKSIAEDKSGNLWVSSNKGVSMINTHTYEIKNYDISDGLQDYEFSDLACVKRHDGEILFGGINGFNAFHPENIRVDTSMPDLVFTGLTVLNKSVKTGEKINGRVILKKNINETEEIKLKYKENSIAIYFAGLYYKAPSKLQYKYKLEGFDDDWINIPSATRLAKYTSLRPGNYTLKVLVSNSDGLWSDNYKKIQIKIIPPIWRSNIAIAIYIILFIGGILFFRRYSIIRIKEKNALLMEHFEKDKIDELAMLKLNFFTNISHEFRTPLTLIIGTIDKLFTQHTFKNTPDNSRSYSLVRRNVNTLLRLIKQLSDFRKYEQGKLELSVAENNIVDFTRQIFDSFENIADQKQINYTFHTSNTAIRIWFDADKTEKVLFNLISNALKFTLEKGVVKVSLIEKEDGVEIEISDNGIGIPKEKQKHIFDLFYRANKLKNMGSGIGLSFSKSLIEMQHGRLSFESQEGKGTSFTVIFSKGSSHFKKDDIQEGEIFKDILNLTENKEWTEPVALGNQTENSRILVKNANLSTVLLVEDDTDVRQFIKESISDEYKIIVASNGREGFEKSIEYIPELIISDIMMPEVNGLEFCEKIKKDDRTSHIPLILLTARGEIDDFKEGYGIKADDYISKPFNIELLKARIKVLISSRKTIIEKFSKNVVLEPTKLSISKTDEKLLYKIISLIEKNMSNPDLSVQFLASELGLSDRNLNRKLQKLTQQTAKRFIRSIRIKRAAQLLQLGTSILDTLDETGFSSRQHFRKCFKEEYHMSPSEYVENLNL